MNRDQAPSPYRRQGFFSDIREVCDSTDIGKLETGFSQEGQYPWVIEALEILFFLSSLLFCVVFSFFLLDMVEETVR